MVFALMQGHHKSQNLSFLFNFIFFKIGNLGCNVKDSKQNETSGIFESD